MRLIIALVLLALAAGCGAIGGGSGAVAGTVEVPAGGDSPPDECIPWTDWLDIRSGTKVTITNESGEIVGSSTLEPSEEIFVDHEPTGEGLYESLWTRSCLFDFSVDVSRDAEFYTVEVGDREGPTYSRAELEEAGWRMDVLLGF